MEKATKKSGALKKVSLGDEVEAAGCESDLSRGSQQHGGQAGSRHCRFSCCCSLEPCMPPAPRCQLPRAVTACLKRRRLPRQPRRRSPQLPKSSLSLSAISRPFLDMAFGCSEARLKEVLDLELPCHPELRNEEPWERASELLGRSAEAAAAPNA